MSENERHDSLAEKNQRSETPLVETPSQSNSSETTTEDKKPGSASSTRSGNSYGGRESAEEEKKCALLAGKAAFSLETYIFRKVLPARMIKLYIFPRNIDDVASVIARYKSLGEETALEGAEKKWERLKEILQWNIAHEQVLESAKQSYLMINPSPRILHKLNTQASHDIKEIRNAFQMALPVHLRSAGNEVVDMLVSLGLT